MTTADWTALITAVVSLVTAITGLIRAELANRRATGARAAAKVIATAITSQAPMGHSDDRG